MKRRVPGAGDIQRREFLNTVAITTLAGKLSFAGLVNRLPMETPAEKPRLSPDNFNRLLASASSAQRRALLTELRSDPAGFHHARFALIPQQEKYLSELTSQDLATIRSGIDVALSKDLLLVMTWTSARRFPVIAEGERVISEGQHIRMGEISTRVSSRSSIFHLAASVRLASVVQVTAIACQQTCGGC